MNKNKSLFLLVILLISGEISTTTYAISNEKPLSYEEMYTEIGYKTVEEAVKDFEQHFKQNLKLPLRVPPITFTHNFGRFSDLDGEINDSLEVKFISDISPENHYKINVRPVKYKIPISDKFVMKVYKLNNGNKATYMKISRLFNVLVFENDNWQYMLSVDKRICDKVTPETLIEIANSIDYLTEKKGPFH
jgi:hypothetical protein